MLAGRPPAGRANLRVPSPKRIFVFLIDRVAGGLADIDTAKGAKSPNRRVFDRMTLRQGSQQLTLANYGPAHTDGDTVIYIAPANIAVVGDIFSNHVYPIIDLSSEESIDGLIHSLDQILVQTGEQTKIVPGYGPLATRADLHDYSDMLV